MSYILSQIESAKPIRQYKYKEQIQRAIDELKNRRFRYDASDDPEYRRFSQRSMRRARRAMEDTLAKGMELSGSRLSSFAQGLAQQRYNEGIADIDKIIPALEKIALDRYNSEGKSLSDSLDGLRGLDSLEQREYEQLLSAWNKDRDYYFKKQQAELARLDRLNRIKKSSGRGGRRRRKTQSFRIEMKSHPGSLRRIVPGRKLA